MAYLTICDRPIKKDKAAEILWPDTTPERARDNLYKVCRFLRDFQEKQVKIPLHIFREELFLDLSEIDCDIKEFERIFMFETNPQQWERAISLYVGPLLFENYYEWTGEDEAFYDVHYCELIQRLAEDCRSRGREDMAVLYEGKIKEF